MATKLRSEANAWLHDILSRRKYPVVLNIGCGKNLDNEGGNYSDYINADKIFMIDKKFFLGITVLALIEYLPFRGRVADLVFGNWVIHKTDLSYSIQEICHILKPYGEIVLSYSDPNLKRIKQVGDSICKRFRPINIFGPKFYPGKAMVPDKNVQIFHGELWVRS